MNALAVIQLYSLKTYGKFYFMYFFMTMDFIWFYSIIFPPPKTNC